MIFYKKKIIVLKLGLARQVDSGPERPGTLPTRGWNSAEFQKNREKKNPVATRWFFLLKQCYFDLKKFNPNNMVKTWNPDQPKAGPKNYAKIINRKYSIYRGGGRGAGGGRRRVAEAYKSRIKRIMYCSQNLEPREMKRTKVFFCFSFLILKIAPVIFFYI